MAGRFTHVAIEAAGTPSATAANARITHVALEAAGVPSAAPANARFTHVAIEVAVIPGGAHSLFGPWITAPVRRIPLRRRL